MYVLFLCLVSMGAVDAVHQHRNALAGFCRAPAPAQMQKIIIRRGRRRPGRPVLLQRAAIIQILCKRLSKIFGQHHAFGAQPLGQHAGRSQALGYKLRADLRLIRIYLPPKRRQQRRKGVVNIFLLIGLHAPDPVRYRTVLHPGNRDAVDMHICFLLAQQGKAARRFLHKSAL